MAAGKCQNLHNCFVYVSSEGLLFAGHAYTQAGKLLTWPGMHLFASAMVIIRI